MKNKMLARLMSEGASLSEAEEVFRIAFEFIVNRYRVQWQLFPEEPCEDCGGPQRFHYAACFDDEGNLTDDGRYYFEVRAAHYLNELMDLADRILEGDESPEIERRIAEMLGFDADDLDADDHKYSIKAHRGSTYFGVLIEADVPTGVDEDEFKVLVADIAALINDFAARQVEDTNPDLATATRESTDQVRRFLNEN